MRKLLGGALMVLCALVVGVGVVVGGQAARAAQTLDDGPPVTALRKGELTLQKGRQGSYCWTDGCADYVPSYPTADQVRAGSKLYVRIFKAQRPERFGISAYRKLGEFDHPVGKSRKVAYSFRPVVRGGEIVAWDTVFRVEEPNRHYYLGAFGIWEEGDSSWTYHVQTAG